MKISIICITYNQKKYISRAIDSFLTQKIDVDLEIIVNDDASTDGTTDILKTYDGINLKVNKRNMGGPLNMIDALIRSKGDYVVICEGDDFFIDNLKIAKQLQLLQSNPSINICCHPAYRHDFQTGQRDVIGLDNQLFIDFKNIFLGVQIPTCSLMFNRVVINRIITNHIKNKHPISGDYIIRVLGSYPNGIICHPDIMSEYSYNSYNSFSTMTKNNYKYYFDNISELVKSLENISRDYNLDRKVTNKAICKIIINSCRQTWLSTYMKLSFLILNKKRVGVFNILFGLFLANNNIYKILRYFYRFTKKGM